MVYSRLTLFCFLCLLPAAPQAEMGLFLLGIESEEQPLGRQELLRRIYLKLRNDPHVVVHSREDMEMLYRKGLIASPRVSLTQARKMTELWGDQCFAYGRLLPVEKEFRRSWWKPWDGRVIYRFALKLKIIHGEKAEYRFNGVVPVEVTYPHEPKSWSRPLDFISPVVRDRAVYDAMELLAERSAWTISTALLGLDSEDLTMKMRGRRIGAATSAPGPLQIELGTPPSEKEAAPEEEQAEDDFVIPLDF